MDAGVRPADSHLGVSTRGQGITVMDASVLVVVTYRVQLLVKSLIQHCQHHWSLVPKRRETMNHIKKLKKMLVQRCWKFTVTMIFRVSVKISDNDSMSSVDMDDACV